MEERLMSPWDALEWFEAPIETPFTGVPAGTLVAPYNQRRVALIISNDTSSTMQFSTNPNGITGQGIQVTQQAPFFILTQRDHGVLCQAAWYLTTAITGTCTVIEARLRDWPRRETLGE